MLPSQRGREQYPLSETEVGKGVGYSFVRLTMKTLDWGPGSLLTVLVVKQFYIWEEIKLRT